MDFKQAIKNINYDIIGLAEIRRIGYNIEEDDEHIFCSYGETKGHYGVGFLIKKKYKLNIESFIALTERICILNLKFDKETLSIVQVYAPTAESTEQQINEFYNQLQIARRQCYKHQIILGDFNARVGQRLAGEERILGNYCYGKRDKRGEMLLQFCWENNLFILNSLFKKNTKNMWTWLSPKNRKSQIDYILTNHKENVTNFEILNRLSFPSDHRFIRSTIIMAKLRKSRANYRNTKSKLITPEDKQNFLQTLSKKMNTANLDNCEDVESFYNIIKKSILESLNCTQNEPSIKQYYYGRYKATNSKKT